MIKPMIPFTSDIKWVNIQGEVEFYSSERFQEKCLNACAFFSGLSGDKFAILWESSPEALAMFIGGMLAGKVVCFYSIPNFKLDTGYFEKQSEALKEQGLHTVGSPKFRHLDLDTIFDLEGYTVIGTPIQDPSMDFMQFSSGTTGIRKRISYRGQELMQYVREFSKVIGITENDTVATWTPHYHDEGLIYGFLVPLLTGSDILIMSNLDWVMNPDLFLEACLKHRADILTQPNFAYSMMVDRCNKRDLSFMKFYSVGEVVNHQDCLAFEEKFKTKVYGALGLAEAIYAVTDSDDNTSHRENVRNSGKCFGKNEIKIADGEILLRSPYLFKGYDTGEEARIEDGWYYTGDEGVIEDGLLYVLGRKDSSFKVRGQKMLPELVEMAINNLPGVKKGRNVCFGIDSKNTGKRAVLLYEGQASVQDVIKVASNLGVEVVKNVPEGWLVKSSSGKISRKYCKDKFLEEF